MTQKIGPTSSLCWHFSWYFFSDWESMRHWIRSYQWKFICEVQFLWTVNVPEYTFLPHRKLRRVDRVLSSKWYFCFSFCNVNEFTMLPVLPPFWLWLLDSTIGSFCLFKSFRWVTIWKILKLSLLQALTDAYCLWQRVRALLCFTVIILIPAQPRVRHLRTPV